MWLQVIVLTSLYGALAAGAARLTWHDWDLRWVGCALVTSFLVSNITFWLEYNHVIAPSVRPGVYSVLEMAVTATSFSAWDRDNRPCLIAIVAVSVASITANIAYTLLVDATPRQKNQWEVTTNVFFAAECLLAIWLGWRHGVRVGYFVDRSTSGRHALESHAHKEGP